MSELTRLEQVLLVLEGKLWGRCTRFPFLKHLVKTAYPPSGTLGVPDQRTTAQVFE